MAYDRSKNLKDYGEFFTVHIIKERDISRFNTTTKIPDTITKNIKHEYGTKGAGSKGLFSHDKIMAYLLVFDYDDPNSLQDVLELYYNIASDENIKVSNEKFKTVKIFICNKYTGAIEDVEEDLPNHELVKLYMHNDDRTKDIINRIQSRVEPYEAVRMTYFTSCRHNIGVKNLFNCVFNEIKHREALWQKITYEENKVENSDDEDKKQEDNSTGFFCCKRSKKKENKLEESALKNQSFQDKKKFKDDHDIEYDLNQHIPPTMEEKEVKEQKNEGGGCIII